MFTLPPSYNQVIDECIKCCAIEDINIQLLMDAIGLNKDTQNYIRSKAEERKKKNKKRMIAFHYEDQQIDYLFQPFYDSSIASIEYINTSSDTSSYTSSDINDNSNTSDNSNTGIINDTTTQNLQLINSPLSNYTPEIVSTEFDVYAHSDCN
jgi:hypothetical protein